MLPFLYIVRDSEFLVCELGIKMLIQVNVLHLEMAINTNAEKKNPILASSKEKENFESSLHFRLKKFFSEGKDFKQHASSNLNLRLLEKFFV